jgi:hypothetical protein
MSTAGESPAEERGDVHDDREGQGCFLRDVFISEIKGAADRPREAGD